MINVTVTILPFHFRNGYLTAVSLLTTKSTSSTTSTRSSRSTRSTKLARSSTTSGHFKYFQLEGKIAIGYVDTNLNPADLFTKKLKSTKYDSYIDIISGNASTIPGDEKSLPMTLKTRMFSPPLWTNHIADRVHQGPQDSMPVSTQDDS